MDELVHFNKARWEAQAQADVLYARPWLNLDSTSARERLDAQMC